MRKKFISLTVFFLSLFLIALITYHCFKSEILLTMTITAGVFVYHFLMRLTVGSIINAIFHNDMDYYNRWFKQKKFEKKLYAFLQVRKWRKYIPTYSPETFSAELHSRAEIAAATCQAEVVHELIALLSFAPILLIIPFGTPAVFITTSVLSALFDTLFVILQRYNRPLIVKLIERDKKLSMIAPANEETVI